MAHMAHSRAPSLHGMVPTPLGAARSAAILARLSDLAKRAFARQWGRFGAWRLQRASLAALGALDAATLKDIGLHRSEIGSVVFDTGERKHRVDRAPRFVRYY